MTEKYSEVSRLFDACNGDYEYAALEGLCIEAGILWQCTASTEEFPDNCGANNHEDDTVCCDCGAPKPENT